MPSKVTAREPLTARTAYVEKPAAPCVTLVKFERAMLKFVALFR